MIKRSIASPVIWEVLDILNYIDDGLCCSFVLL
jgi:hypothetical protein